MSKRGAGRPATCDSKKISDEILAKSKDIITESGKIAKKSHPIWKIISKDLKIKPLSLYSYVTCNRFNIRCKLYEKEGILLDAFPHLKIVNGTNAREGEFPSVVSLRNNLRHTCGGTILNSQYILTAAHCACDNNKPNNPAPYSIQYGSIHISATEERSIKVKEIICGPFNMQTLVYDVAVLKLKTPLPNNGLWKPVRLAKSFDTSRQHSGVVVGWGRLWQDGPIPSTLQKLDITTFTNTVCGLRFDNHHHICFGAAVGGVCNGDSGTSLMVNGEQVGIASFITNTCGITSAFTPNVYARVPSYYDWIEQHSRI